VKLDASKQTLKALEHLKAEVDAKLTAAEQDHLRSMDKLLEEQTRVLEDKEQARSAIEQTLRKTDQQLSEKVVSESRKALELAALQNELREAHEAARLQLEVLRAGTLSEKQALELALTEDLERKAAMIASLQSEIASLLAKLSGKEQELLESANTLAQKEQLLSGQTSAFEVKLDASKQTLKALEHLKAEVDAELTAALRSIAELQSALSEKKRVLEEEDRLRSAIEQTLRETDQRLSEKVVLESVLQ